MATLGYIIIGILSIIILFYIGIILYYLFTKNNTKEEIIIYRPVEEVTKKILDIKENETHTFEEPIVEEIMEETIEEEIEEELNISSKRFCIYCGSEIDSDSIFCYKCGKRQ